MEKISQKFDMVRRDLLINSRGDLNTFVQNAPEKLE